MSRTRKHVTRSDVLIFLLLGTGILMTVLGAFSIGLQSLHGTVDVQNNPSIDILIVGIIVVIGITALNLMRRSSVHRHDPTK
jgi:hypothetical protein